MTEPPVPAIANQLVLCDVEQVAALAHVVRVAVLRLLIAQPMTSSQLAQALGGRRARMHYHVQELLKAGLIQLVEERPKINVIEKYYRAVARAYVVTVTDAGIVP